MKLSFIREVGYFRIASQLFCNHWVSSPEFSDSSFKNPSTAFPCLDSIYREHILIFKDFLLHLTNILLIHG